MSDASPDEPPGELRAYKMVAYVSMSPELRDEYAALAEAQEAYFAMTPEQHAEHDRELQAQRAAQAAAELVAAQGLVADIRLAAYASSPGSGEWFFDTVLELHAPQVRGGDWHVTCGSCWDDGEYDTPLEWPCPTIAALKEAARV